MRRICLLRSLIFVCLAPFVTTGSSAATVTAFTFPALPQPVEDSVTLARGHLTVTVSARASDGTRTAIDPAPIGWGATGTAEGGRLAAGEGLTFAFNEAVALKEVSVLETGVSREFFELWVGSEKALEAEVFGLSFNIDIPITIPLPSVEGRVFTLIGTSQGPSRFPDEEVGLRVVGMSVAIPAPVPLPASGLLLAGLLAVVAASQMRVSRRVRPQTRHIMRLPRPVHNPATHPKHV